MRLAKWQCQQTASRKCFLRQHFGTHSHIANGPEVGNVAMSAVVPFCLDSDDDPLVVIPPFPACDPGGEQGEASLPALCLFLFMDGKAWLGF